MSSGITLWSSNFIRGSCVDIRSGGEPPKVKVFTVPQMESHLENLQLHVKNDDPWSPDGGKCNCIKMQLHLHHYIYQMSLHLPDFESRNLDNCC